MGKDVLSQSEIDSIINALSSGDLDDNHQDDVFLTSGEAVPYDFRRPNKFSKDQMRTLRNIHENFARMLANFLTAFLRLPVTVKLESTSQVTYAEFTYSLPVPTLVTVFSFSDRSASALIESNHFFTSPIIDILFGGEGKMIKQNRELTEIELSVLRKVNEKLLKHLRAAWEDILDIKPDIQSLDTNPHFGQLLASNEAVALLTFSTNIAGNEGFINLCLPYIALEPVLARLSAQNWQAAQSKNVWDITEARKSLVKRLKSTEMELTAVLGCATISVADFLNFEDGDIILLDRQVDKPVDLYLDGKPKFKIHLGASGTSLAGEVAEILTEQEETDE